MTKVYFQLHASLRFVSLFNVEAALAAQMSPAPAVRATGIFPGVPAGQSTTVYVYFVSPYFDHDAFMHHPMHVLYAPATSQSMFQTLIQLFSQSVDVLNNYSVIQSINEYFKHLLSYSTTYSVIQSVIQLATVGSPRNEVRGHSMNLFLLLPCPGLLFGSMTVLICLREF